MTGTPSIFSPERYRETRKPIEKASPLPPEVYFSHEWYEREIDTIFRKGWLIATREEEIPTPGDYVRLDIVGEPLIILRDDNGEVRAMSAGRHAIRRRAHGCRALALSNMGYRTRCCCHMTSQPSTGSTPMAASAMTT